MQRVYQEVWLKNASLGTVSQLSPNAFHYPSQATPPLEQVAAFKYQQSSSGSLPSTFLVDERLRQLTARDWVKMALLLTAIAAAFYLLLKYKIITL